MNPKILAVIPARGGSKGVKDKNIRILNGKPLIAWTIEQAKHSKYIDRLIVSTDDHKIAQVSKHYGSEVMMRPAQLAQDDSPTSDTLIYTLEQLKESGYIPDYLLLLQCTSPLRKTEHIDEAIGLFLENIDSVDSLISVTPVEHPVQWFRTVDKEGFMHNYFNYDMHHCHQRQSFEQVYRLNGAIYIIKINIYLQHHVFQTDRTLPYIMDNESSIDIDTEMDLWIAESIMKKLSQSG